jgi:branched-chain amino acid transport system permease protein
VTSITVQLLLNSLAASGAIVLVALGFTLCYGTARFFNFAHGAIVTVGAYLALVFARISGLPLAVSCALAIAGGGVLGCAIEVLVYRPLRQRAASRLALLVASLGLYGVIQNAVSLVFGDDVQTIPSASASRLLSFLGATTTHAQVWTIVASAVLVVAASLLLHRTRAGRAMRAAASDPELAAVSGIDSEQVMLWTFSLASCLAAAAGILIALDVDMVPSMGLNALLAGVVAAIVGGAGSVSGAAAGGVLLGFAQNLSAWKLGSEWQDPIAFAILLGFLVLRPYGILGRRPRTVGT